MIENRRFVTLSYWDIFWMSFILSFPFNVILATAIYNVLHP